jgi:hypothetical protein
LKINSNVVHELVFEGGDCSHECFNQATQNLWAALFIC